MASDPFRAEVARQDLRNTAALDRRINEILDAKTLPEPVRRVALLECGGGCKGLTQHIAWGCTGKRYKCSVCQVVRLWP